MIRLYSLHLPDCHDVLPQLRVILLHGCRSQEEAGDCSFLGYLEELTGIPNIMTLCQNMPVDKALEGAAHVINNTFTVRCRTEVPGESLELECLAKFCTGS